MVELHCPTNAKNHFGFISRVGVSAVFSPTKSPNFVYFDGLEYFVNFNE